MHMVLGVVYKSERRHRTRGAVRDVFPYASPRRTSVFPVSNAVPNHVWPDFFHNRKLPDNGGRPFCCGKTGFYNVWSRRHATTGGRSLSSALPHGRISSILYLLIEAIVNRFFPFFTFHSQCAKPFFICTTCLFSSSNVSVCTRTAYLPDARKWATLLWKPVIPLTNSNTP